MEYYNKISDADIKSAQKHAKKISSKKNKTYKLVYIINNKIRETISNNPSYSLLVYLKKKAKSTGNYNEGKLKIIKT